MHIIFFLNTHTHKNYFYYEYEEYSRLKEHYHLEGFCTWTE